MRVYLEGKKIYVKISSKKALKNVWMRMSMKFWKRIHLRKNKKKIFAMSYDENKSGKDSRAYFFCNM